MTLLTWICVAMLLWRSITTQIEGTKLKERVRALEDYLKIDIYGP